MFNYKKSLGQHFLVDENVSRSIAGYIREIPCKQLLEVGPGGGALTKYLLKLPETDFKCVELDEEKVAWLKKNFPKIEGKIIQGDILEIDAPFSGNFTLVGNFPYNISTQIVFRILDWKDQVDYMVGMFQKEVAERIVSGEGSKVYGVTSVLVQAFYDAEYLMTIPESAFKPPPKVKSAVIKLTRKTDAPVKSQKEFFNLVKTAFNQRRKTLRNAVKSLFDEETLQDPIFQKRAEQLSVDEFASLSFKMK